MCHVPNVNTALRSTESSSLREQGNKLFKESPERNALAACRLYTKAILAAPPGSEDLALAHANRGMAMQKFGYFQQAYDDCVCALEQGYPKNLTCAIIARQAICAEKLGEAKLLQKHLDSLETNKTYATLVQKLKQSLEKLKLQEIKSEKNAPNVKEYRGAHRIIKTASKGRCLIAKNSIKKDELIFTERAVSFVPVARRQVLVCQYCAVTQFIPFPCYNCNGCVFYCSIKCKVAHQTIHEYECLAYQKDLFVMKREYLALRMVLDGIPDIIPYLCQKQTAKDIWNELTCEKSSLMQSKYRYIQSLRMITHLEKKSLEDILNMAYEAYLMTHYLRYQTNFFNLFKKAEASLEDWQLVIASLILRHAGHSHFNGMVLPVLTIKFTDPFESTLLVGKLWQSPFHVRRGLLHMFCNIEQAIRVNVPYYSLCNHDCDPSMVTIKNGRYISAFAVNDIEAGSEITTSYTMGYRNNRGIMRQVTLWKRCHFVCLCVKCTMENPDEDYEKNRRYRCEKCYKVFIADYDEEISCTKCHAFQYKLCEKVQLIKKKFRTSSEDIDDLITLLNTHKDLDQWLVGSHVLKFELLMDLLKKFFEMPDSVTSSVFNLNNFSRIIDILKLNLSYIAKCENIKSISYVGPMTYLWDFIALGKYKCSGEEMQEMLQAMDGLEDETRKLFINYYNDYIVGYVK